MAVFYRAAVAAVAVAATLAAPAPASAQVSAPTGATLPMGSPILIQWTPLFWASPTVSIELNRVSPTPTSFGNLVANIPNNGQTSVNLPHSLACNPAHTYRITVWAKINSTTWMTKDSAHFKLSCEGGSIKVVKTVINDSGGPIANGTFAVDVNCGPNGPNTTLALSNANNFQDSVMYIPLGRQCTITEQAPKAPPGCHWATTYPQGKNVVISNADKQRDGHPFYQREIRNRLTCLGGGSTGPVEVDVAGPLTAILEESTTTACCTPHWGNYPPGSYNNPQSIAYCSVPTQALCASKSNPVIACVWNTQDPGCSGAGVSTGTLTIIKKVVNDSTTIPPPNTPFQVQVTCSPGGPNVPVTLTSANGFTQVVGDIPANRSCTLVEQAPAISRDLAKRGCRWETSYPDGQVAAMPNPAAALSLTVINRWTCTQTAASCCAPDWTSVPADSYNNPQIIAACSATTQAQCVSNAAINCLWNAQDPRCSAGGGSSGKCCTQQLPNNNANCGDLSCNPPSTSAQANCLAVGNHAAQKGCNWNPECRSGESLGCCLQRDPKTASFVNCQGFPAGGSKDRCKAPCQWNPLSNRECRGEPATGTITVTKRIRNRTSTPTPTTAFQVKLDCSPGGPSQIVSLTSPDSLEQTISVPLGSICTIAEIPPAAPSSCRWETSYPNDQEGKVGSKLVVENELLCDENETGTITVTKKIRNRTSTPTPSTAFQVQLDCSPGGPNQIVSLTSPDSLQQTISVPLGSICRIAEIAPAAPRPCRWETSYPNDQEGKVGSKLVVENELLCDEEETDTGSGAPCCTPDWSSVPPESFNHPAIIAACPGPTQALCPSNAAVNCIWNPRCAGAGDPPACVKAGASCTSASRCCGKLTCSGGVCQ